MDAYAIYLRKSRSDEAAEARGNGDVLTSHRKTLTELAERCGYTVIAEYAEVASGDRLDERPEAQRLLLDVVAGKYAGVLCMALDRLSRGAMEDQTAVIRSFQASATLLITPDKTYNFSDPTDEDTGELKLFISRFEYKAIKRRMYAGRERSARDGWYLGTRNPYGYERVPAQGGNGPTLRPLPDQAAIVREIFQLYADGIGSHCIAGMLDQRGIKPNYSNFWDPTTIRSMLRNPLYIGRITWGKRIAAPLPDNSRHRVRNPNMIDAQGKHPPLVDRGVWDAVQARLAGNMPPAAPGRPLQNPLRGLVICARCGRTMQRACDQRGTPSLRCMSHGCEQARCKLDVVETVILERLEQAYADIDLRGSDVIHARQQKERDRAAKQVQEQITQAERQMARQADLLELGVYSVEEFVSRRDGLRERLTGLHRRLAELRSKDSEETRYEALRAAIPRSCTISEAYRRAATPQQKNDLLAALISRIVYNKTEHKGGRYIDPRAGLVLDIEYKC